jgi:hypothetical protein
MASLLERGLLTELITCTTNLCDAHRQSSTRCHRELVPLLGSRCTAQRAGGRGPTDQQRTTGARGLADAVTRCRPGRGLAAGGIGGHRTPQDLAIIGDAAAGDPVGLRARTYHRVGGRVVEQHAVLTIAGAAARDVGADEVAVPPIVQAEAFSRAMPSPPLPRSAVPEISVPIKLPQTGRA